ncbi:hypothetical protein [Nocardia sp. IFM 10818]
MELALIEKVVGAVAPGRLVFLGSSAVGLLTAAAVLDVPTDNGTPLSILAGWARGLGWESGQVWFAAAHDWVVNPSRVLTVVIVAAIAAGMSLALNHVRVRGRRPVYAIPVALYGMAVLVEAGALDTAATVLVAGVVCSVLPEMHWRYPIRSVVSAAVITVADLACTAVWLVICVVDLLYPRPAVPAGSGRGEAPA